MANTQLKEQILKSVYRRIGQFANKNTNIMEVKAVEFSNTDQGAFLEAVNELVNDGLISHRNRDWFTFTPEGRDKAFLLMNPPTMVNQNTLNVANIHDSHIQQGIHSDQQITNYRNPSNDELRRLVDLMTEHLGELQLPVTEERKVKAQIATIDAQLTDVPNPTIIREAFSSIKNITEGAIGGFLSTAAQPGVWEAIRSILALMPLPS